MRSVLRPRLRVALLLSLMDHAYSHDKGRAGLKHLIMTDLEGPAGVERFSQTYDGEPFKLPAMRLLTLEVNACIEGILDADPAAEIAVFDGHGAGGILRDLLDGRARYVRERADRDEVWRRLGEFSTYLYVGQHAFACMPNAPLCHTGSSKHVVYKRFNGVFIGEFGEGALLAGHHDVPLIFLSGDDKAVFEAQGLIPGIYTVTTKWGVGWQKARHLEPEEARRRIRAGAREAVLGRSRIAPLKVEPPYTYEVRYIHPRTSFRTDIPGVKTTVLDPRTVLYRFDDMARFRTIAYGA